MQNANKSYSFINKDNTTKKTILHKNHNLRQLCDINNDVETDNKRWNFQLKEELKEINEKREDAQKIVERLKIGVSQGQKEIAEQDKKIKKLQREIREMKN